MADSAPTVAGLVEKVSALAPLIRAHAAENERERRLAPPVVDALLESGLFRVMLPERFGGAGLSMVDAMPIFEEAAYADGSTGWNLAIGAGSASFALLLDDEAALEEIFKAPRALCAGGLNPMALRIVPDGDGYRAGGRLAYASGVSQSTWIVGGGMVFDGDRPRLSEGGLPLMIGAFFPTAEATVLDTWQVSGLAGTGSHDVEIGDVFVPRTRTFAFLSTSPKRYEPLAAIPLPTRLGTSLVAVGLGITRRAIDELAALAGEKKPFMSHRPLHERAPVQIDVGRAAGWLDAARAHVAHVGGEVFARVRAGAQPTLTDFVRLRLAYVTATESLGRAVDLVRAAAGMNGIFAGSALDRCWRDAHALTQHFALSSTHFERLGKIRLGLDPGPGPI